MYIYIINLIPFSQASISHLLSSMATVIPESIAFTCSANPRNCRTTAPAVSFSLQRSSCSLPEFSGLKIQFRSNRSSVSVNLRNSRVLRHRAGIVCEAQETALDIPTVNDYTWKSLVLKADGPVLVEFWAPWCGPCRMIHPVISDLAEQYAGKLKCFKLSTDESPSIATEYGVRSIPTVMIFNNGEKKDAIMGGVPKTTLKACIEKFL